MKLNQIHADSKSTGYFVHFSYSSDEKIHVDIDQTDQYRKQISVLLPPNKVSNRIAYLLAILRKLYSGGIIPLRMEYENVKDMFTLEDLFLVEKSCNYFSFHLYGVPNHLIPSQQCKLDIRKIQNKVRRESDREARLRYLARSHE